MKDTAGAQVKERKGETSETENEVGRRTERKLETGLERQERVKGRERKKRKNNEVRRENGELPEFSEKIEREQSIEEAGRKWSGPAAPSPEEL